MYTNGYGSDRNNDAGGYTNGDSLGMNGYSAGSAGRERRAGGYGGFYVEESQAPPTVTTAAASASVAASAGASSPVRTRDLHVDTGATAGGAGSSRWRAAVAQAQAQAHSQRDDDTGTSGYVASRTRERERADTVSSAASGGRGVKGAQAIEDVLQSIQREWDFMSSESCIPVQVALQLMDSSTLGKADREPEFLDMHKQIQKTLKAIVNGELRSVYFLYWLECVLKSFLRTPPGIQQLHRYVPQNPVQHTELAEPGPCAEGFSRRRKGGINVDEAGTEGTGDVVPEVR